MELFLDTLDLEVIRKYSDMGIISGVTTNPTLARRYKMGSNSVEMIKRVRDAMEKGEIHVEAFGDTAEEILNEVDRLHSIDPNLVYKIPFTIAGADAVRKLKTKVTNLKVNMHLIFSHNQALIAVKLKSDYICPLVGRLDDEGHEGLLFIDELVRTFSRDGVDTKIMVSSVRNPMHVIRAFKVGADAITIPAEVMEKMFKHRLTDDGFERFKRDMQQC